MFGPLDEMESFEATTGEFGTASLVEDKSSKAELKQKIHKVIEISDQIQDRIHILFIIRISQSKYTRATIRPHKWPSIRPHKWSSIRLITPILG